MTALQMTGRQLMSLAAASWLMAVVIVRGEAEAVLYDPFVEGGAKAGPWISNRLPVRVRQKIESAIELVEHRLQERPSCASLFTELGKDGIAVIKRTLYYPANVLMERRICWRSYAFTKVGVRPTWICRRMWLLPVSRFALVLLHEALHHAGLEEWPQVRQAPDSHAISGRVATACGF
jgi:hypothetical protein